MAPKFLSIAVLSVFIACSGIAGAQGGAPTKSAEQSALQRGQAALGNGDIEIGKHTSELQSP